MKCSNINVYHHLQESCLHRRLLQNVNKFYIVACLPQCIVSYLENTFDNSFGTFKTKHEPKVEVVQ